MRSTWSLRIRQWVLNPHRSIRRPRGGSRQNVPIPRVLPNGAPHQVESTTQDIDRFC